MHPPLTLDLSSAQFWIAVAQIILIDILLSGDNAVVIALACRNLPQRQRKLGIVWGVGGAIALRVALTFFAVSLLNLPYVKLAGAALLFWIGVKLILPEGNGEGSPVQAASGLFGAVRTVILADLVMSLDNVIAVAAAARDSIFLLLFGLTLSIPLMVWASRLILRLMDRFPFIIVLGGALLGWIAASMMIEDPLLEPVLEPHMWWLAWAAPAAGAVLVVAAGKLIVARRPAAEARIGSLAAAQTDRANREE